MKRKQKVIVGLSGGVDSSVAIIKLLEAGYEVEALFMRNWDSAANNDISGNPTINDEICPQEVDYQDAKAVAEKLGVKLHRVDFIKEYWDKVFTYFLNEYRKNRTPNPDIMCNKEIKFKAFLDHALTLGADYIAMGHYARVLHDHDNDRHYLLRGLDNNKDQSYFLSQLTREQLSKVLFPIGEMTKKEVRALAEKYDLATATKKDSTGVCFIGERNFKAFLQNYLYAQKGEMQTLDGKVVGMHDGIMYYTIGQRHGLGIGGEGEPWFVIGKIPEKNILLVGQGAENEYLYANRCIVTDVNIINERFPNEHHLHAKFRYRQTDIPVVVRWLDETTLEVDIPSKAKAVTPGQAFVLYDGEYCLGGGTIDQVFMDDERRKY
jgi:tRNA-specific 2-thiouridylase